MNKSIVSFLFCLTAFLFISSCDKDSENLDSVLFGTWNVTKVQGQQFTNGIAGLVLTDNSPSGYVRFDNDGTGKQDYSFTLFGTAYPNVSDFLWESNDNEIIIKRYAQSDLSWERIINESNKQEATYKSVVNATLYWNYTLTLER